MIKKILQNMIDGDDSFCMNRTVMTWWIYISFPFT